jgi:hypothetical protein
MALYRYVSHEHTDEKGVVWENIGPETEETPCVRCGGEAFPQVCPGDGRSHHHGCVHTVVGRLDPVCNRCYPHVVAEWETAKDIRELPEVTSDSP